MRSVISSGREDERNDRLVGAQVELAIDIRRLQNVFVSLTQGLAMKRLVLFGLAIVLTGFTSCNKQSGSTEVAADLMSQKPTEDEVRRTGLALRSGSKVTLLSPLLEVPDLFFTKSNKPIDPAAVACYVSIRSEPRFKGDTPSEEIMLFIVGRDPGDRIAKDRGRPRLYQPMTYPVPEYMGADWYVKHPWPKDAGKK